MIAKKNIVLLLSLVLVAGCRQKNVKLFPSLKQAKTYQETRDNLSVTVKEFSHKETIDYFGVDLQSHGYQPLQVVMRNMSNNTFIIRPSYITVPLVSGKRIAQWMHYDTYSYVMWSSLPALFFWWPAVPCIIAPAGLGMREYNRKITKNLKYRSLNNKDGLEILPYETITKFMFVYASYYHAPFDISFLNKDTQELQTFFVNLKKPL